MSDMKIPKGKVGIAKSIAKMAEELMHKSAEGAGMKAPVVANTELTNVQDFHNIIQDRVESEVMKMKKMMEGFDFKYDKGQRVFTKSSAEKNLPPMLIKSRMPVGDMVMRDEAGKKIIDPTTGKAVRTPFEPGYRVRLERGPDDWAEFDIPQSAIIGDVEMKKGGAVKMGKGGIAKSIADMIKEIRQTRGGYEAQRLERAADEVPNLERLYQEEALRGLFRGDNAAGIMTMKPGDFESYAKRLSAADPITREMIDKKVGQLAKLKGGFSDVPFLEVDRANPKHLANISGHEGRHRMRALEKKGQPTSVVRMLPRASLREAFPRYTREEYIEALRKELGERPLVTPEGSLKANVGETEGVIELPDVYKAGGAVKMGKGGIAKSIADMAAELAKKKTAVLPKGQEVVLPAAESAANLKKFLDSSAEKRRMYHGGKKDIKQFKTRKDMTDEYNMTGHYADERDAVFVSPDPKFTENFSVTGYKDVDEAPVTYPVYVQAEKPFDFDNPDHLSQVKKAYLDIYHNPDSEFYDPYMLPSERSMDQYSFNKRVDSLQEDENNWAKIENEKFQNVLKDLGFDSFYTRERGIKNLGIYDTNKVKSAIGNRGTYDIGEEDITKAEGGAVKMQDGGAATANEAMLRRSRRTSKYSRDVDWLDAETLPEEQPPAEMRAYEPTTRQRLGEFAERALRNVSPAPRARAIADLLTGGREGAAMSAADVVPFLGTGMALEEIAPHVTGALSKGNIGEAALYGGLGIAAAIPGIPGTVKGAKAIGRAIAPKAGELAEQYMFRTGMTLPIVPPDIANKLKINKALPLNNPIFDAAVANTPNAEITENGLLMRVQRNQTPQQSGMESVRGGVFYLPEGAAQAKHYSTGKTGYGGKEKITGETLLSNPLFAKGGTGGKAPESAYDSLLGKGSYQSMREDALRVRHPDLIKQRGGSLLGAITPEDFLAKYAPELKGMGDYIFSNSRQGNQLAYALQEAAVASAVRNAGHDAVLGYSKGKSGPFISEVFDVRESHYPDLGGGSEVWPDLFKKKGGPVSLDAMRLAVGGMAGGGRSSLIRGGIETVSKGLKSAEKAKQYATPAKFERAPAKTKAEVEALAQRMAPQFLGEFVRKPESTFSVAGKSMKQYRREKDLPIVYGGERPTPDVFDITKHEGEMMVGVPGDPTIAHRTLEQIGDIRPDAPVELHGGPLYGLEGEFWASGKGPATGLQAVARRGSEAYGGVPVVGQYIRMPEGTPYALHTTDALLSFQRPEMLGKRKLEQLNAEIRRGNLKNKFPEFVGFEDPDLVLLQAQDNPNLRKHINNVLLKPTTAEKYGLYPGPDIDAAITEAGLRNLETGATGFSVGRLFPESKLIESAHPTYEFDIPGRMIGQTKYPQPYELTFPDALKFAREGLKPGVGEFGMLKMIGPRQIIDAQLVDEINMYQEAMKKLTGKKKGGTVKKAVGGGVMSAGQKLAKAFVEAGKKAKLPEQAKEAASKGELFLPDEEVKRMQRELLQGVKKPEELAVGGQITSDDLILEERPL